MKNLTNKVALVTGGSRGIGAAIVERLAADGAKVAFTYTSDSSSEKASAIVAGINAAGGRALAIKADSRYPDEVTGAVSATVKEFGSLDILVSNAGIFIAKDVSELSLSDYDELMDINVKAVYVATLEAIKHLKAGGRIITIGSNMGDNAIMPKTLLYTMSKSALQGFTRALARDLGPKGISVTLVQPGPTTTDMNPDNTEFSDFLRSRMALPEYGTAQNIAALVAFLAGEESKYITGSFLTADSGFNA
ncbi:SDR family NAD(P)-dependent oxidoreductase [Mucilaginibacter myungsuensis]|uniref:SDR family oxidoreductase n=1 Tax=Mucilaginibacter myungsuensis TaxID=649104 RepID=A0A929KZ01_9SPHI|nr:SDR family oxidoreductase [Mucilaginibacter myungsuensis]MBE9663058.1 SDR family oxidoreductase [Mucilaginibacter myungsuensis]MDN3598692.1 SDR family oxidoreductase [Mucilaginibacter myungsuensis]